MAVQTQVAQGEQSSGQSGIRALVRIANTDIDGNKGVYYGLSRIYGVSYAFSNAICQKMGLERNRKIGSLSSEEVSKIEEFLSKGYKELPHWLFDRKSDFESGEDLHVVGPNLKLRREFDIRLLKRLRTYRGMRHAMGQPVRGQRTKSHFRTGRTVGVMKKAAKLKAAAAESKGEKKEKK